MEDGTSVSLSATCGFSVVAAAEGGRERAEWKICGNSLPFRAAQLEQSECVCDHSSRGTQFARGPTSEMSQT